VTAALWTPQWRQEGRRRPHPRTPIKVMQSMGGDRDSGAAPEPPIPGPRPLIVAADGGELRKSSLDTAWQRLIKMAIEEEVITKEERFGLHDLKRRGITDTKGTRHDKQEASGHRSAAMLDVYDLSTPIVPWPGAEKDP